MRPLCPYQRGLHTNAWKHVGRRQCVGPIAAGRRSGARPPKRQQLTQPPKPEDLERPEDVEVPSVGWMWQSGSGSASSSSGAGAASSTPRSMPTAASTVANLYEDRIKAKK